MGNVQTPMEKKKTENKTKMERYIEDVGEKEEEEKNGI
jgi:hypothetical protein